MNIDNIIKPEDLFTFGKNEIDTTINAIVEDLKNATIYVSITLSEIDDEDVKEKLQKAIQFTTAPLGILMEVEEYNKTLYKKEKS